MTTATINTGVNSLSTLKGRAAHTAKRIINAIQEDNEPSMCHTFAALTDGAKAIVLQAGHYSNTYIRGNASCMDAAAAAQKLETTAAANVTRKLSKIDHAAAVAFLAEYISRQRKAIEAPTTPEPTTPENDTTMKDETTNNVQEYSHAARCLQTWLDNSEEIYSRYTVPAIKATAKQIRLEPKIKALPAGYVLNNESMFMPGDMARAYALPALMAAFNLVQKHDHITPTPADIAAVKANYVAYIVECAQYEVTAA